MQITRTTDYAVRVVLYLASHASDGPVTAADIARGQGIPLVYIPKVLQMLSRAGIVVNYPGRTGGARLQRPARELSVLDIVEALEGPIALNRCLVREGECPRDEFCPVHRIWAEAQENFVRRLRNANVARLLGRQERKEDEGSKRKREER